jgi:acyl-CoA synthetase (AMP-forming)/AMP-acid ligase II
MTYLAQLLSDQAARQPSAPALMAPGRPDMDYACLLGHVRRVVAALNARGIGPGDRVAIVLPNGPEMASAFLGVAAGATSAPLNPGYRESEFDFYLEDLKPKALLVTKGEQGPACEVAARRNIPILELSVDASKPAGWFTLTNETMREEPRWAADEDVALMLHTSGTTSRPKLVPLTHNNICTSAEHICEVLRLTQADRCLNVMPLFHIHGLMAATLASLSAGASVACTEGFVVTRFFEWMDDQQPTWYTAVPTMHQSILSRAAEHMNVIGRNPLRFLRSSSASLPPNVMAQLEETFKAPVIEAYGMTEASHQMSSNPLPPASRKPGSVGIPAGVRIAIMNAEGSLLAAGETGEVVIQGSNVMHGYEGNPEVNEVAFTNGWFRTGDQGRLEADGYLFLTGRMKEIINRGGEKIAPREVDEALLAHPAVCQAVAFAMPHPKLGEDVAAAVVLVEGARVSKQELLATAARILADFKLPRRIIFLEEIPKGPTGKLQRIGLAERLGVEAMYTEGLAEYVEPSTDTQRTIAEIFQNVLAVERVGAKDSFFALSGDSYLATQLILRVQELLKVVLPIYILFKKPTVEALAASVDLARQSGAAPDLTAIPRVEGNGPFPLAPGQYPLWVQEKLAGATVRLHRPGAVQISGSLDPSHLQRALGMVLERHESLRTSFPAQGGRPVQCVALPGDIKLPLTDLSDLPKALRESRLSELAREEAWRPFHLEEGPLVRVHLVRQAGDKHVLLFNMHHIVFDGWSMAVLVEDLGQALDACTGQHRPEWAPLPIRYADYACWQQQRLDDGAFDPALEYWKKQLEPPLPVLELPVDGAAVSGVSHEGGTVTIQLRKGDVDALEGLCRQEGVTLFIVLLSAYQVLLHRLSGQKHLVHGTLTSGRTRAETASLVGLFINTVVLRADLDGDPSFREIVARSRGLTVQMQTHGDVPVELLVKALKLPAILGQNPFFQTVFQLRNLPPARVKAHGLVLESRNIEVGIARFDLFVEAWEEPEGITTRFEYARALFHEATVKRWANQWIALLKTVAADPEQRLSTLVPEDP